MVKRNTLLLLACLVWSAAGFNILRIGILAYPNYLSVWNFLLSALVFAVFQRMVFGKLVKKHTARIRAYEEERHFFLKFFDVKSFLIMAVMMSGGIWLRSGGLAPERFMTAHCPERIIPGRMLIELRENDRIVGANHPEAAEYAKSIYEKVVTGGTIRLTDDLTAEMCKLTENTFRDINIAYANELSKVCDRLGIDVFKLIELANCHPRVNVHTPGVGVGGHCIAVDPWFIHEKFEDITPLICQARLVNDGKPAWVAERVARDVKPGQKVAVLGMSFKANIDDTRESPSVLFANLLRDKGYEIVACEPYICGTVAGYENHSLEEAMALCDYAVITLQHDLFKKNRALIASKPYYDCVGLMEK